MLPQQELTDSLRRVCEADERVAAAALYGSAIRGECDIYSDVDFIVYIYDEALPGLDARQFVERVAPLALFTTDEFGNYAVVFHNLVRGEFHFDPVSKMEGLRSARKWAWARSVEDMLVFDRTGNLAGYIAGMVGKPFDFASAETIEQLAGLILNRIVFGTDVLRRGERARALDHLYYMQRNVQWLARIREHRMEHYPSPAKSFEADISDEAYARFEACVATLAPGSLEAAYRNSWEWAREMLIELAGCYGVSLPDSLITKIDQRMEDWFPVQA